MEEPSTRSSTRDTDLLEKAERPSHDAMRLHPFYRGKIEVTPKCAVRGVDDFSIWYTPGVAAPCTAISRNRELVYEYTNKWNYVAVVSDGTRVLGLGDIGPEAALPVMEGKALIFKYLGGVDAFPICLDTRDADEFIRTVKLLQPSFGGVNLEDIEQPKCFYILERLRAEMSIPVWHDDQQGTAAITVAGVLNALKVVGKNLSDAKVAVIGAGAAGVVTVRILRLAGADPRRIVVCDSKGTLHQGRTDLRDNPDAFEKWRLCRETNGAQVEGSIPDAMRGADVVVGLSRPGPGTIRPEWVAAMAADPVVIACANPVPEIWPWEAEAAGAAVVATGRSDFPNQVNNSLGFPGIFRGALDVRATRITDEMCLTAAMELARFAQENGLSRTRILPTMDEWEVYAREAAAVGAKAVEQGVARVHATYDELLAKASETVRRARRLTGVMMDEGLIPPPPPSSF